MRKQMSVLCVLMAASLIAVGAFLPRIIATVMDQADNDNTGSSLIQAVELDLHDRTQPEGMIRKLAMEQRMYTVPINASEATMTEDEAYAVAERCMADYVDAGIFEWFAYTTRMAEPILGIDATDIDNTAIIWSVAYVNENDPYQSLFIHIDDETGKILYLIFEDYGKENVYPEKSPEYSAQMYSVLDRFTQIFFDQLGLSETKQYYDSNELYAQGDVDGGVYLRNYCIGDSEYGEISIEFYATPAGFCIYYQ